MGARSAAVPRGRGGGVPQRDGVAGHRLRRRRRRRSSGSRAAPSHVVVARPTSSQGDQRTFSQQRHHLRLADCPASWVRSTPCFSFFTIRHTENCWHCPHAVYFAEQGLQNGTVSVRPSVRPSLCLSVPSIDRCSGVWRVCCWAPRRVVDIDRQRRRSTAPSKLHGGQHQMRAVSRLQPPWKAEHRLVKIRFLLTGLFIRK